MRRHAPRRGAGCHRAYRWVRLSLRSWLPTGYLHARLQREEFPAEPFHRKQRRTRFTNVMNRGDHPGTTVRLKWIAGELRMRNWTYLSNNLSKPTLRSPAR